MEFVIFFYNYPHNIDILLTTALAGMYPEWENRGDQPKTEKQR